MSKSIMAERSPLRSLNNDVPSYVTFFNRSYRTVNLFWISYEGKLLRYAHLPPFKGTAMNTFVTHPWIVRDARTGYPLLMNGKPVFQPPTDTHEEMRSLIWIHIPVFSLLRRALEIVFIHYDAETVMTWDMPKTLKELLMKICPITEFGNYEFFEDVSYYELQQLGFQADVDDDDDHVNEADDGGGNDDDNDVVGDDNGVVNGVAGQNGDNANNANEVEDGDVDNNDYFNDSDNDDNDGDDDNGAVGGDKQEDAVVGCGAEGGGEDTNSDKIDENVDKNKKDISNSDRDGDSPNRSSNKLTKKKSDCSDDDS